MKIVGFVEDELGAAPTERQKGLLALVSAVNARERSEVRLSWLGLVGLGLLGLSGYLITRSKRR